MRKSYVMANYYNVNTSESGGTPTPFTSVTTPGGTGVEVVSLAPLILPVYICPLGANGYELCDASNGVLNPNNPFAAAGQEAKVLYRLPVARAADTDTDSYRFAAGITGTFGNEDEWDYSVDVVSGKVSMDLTRTGYPSTSHTELRV